MSEPVTQDELYSTVAWALEQGILHGLMHAAYYPRPHEIPEEGTTASQLDTLKAIARGLAIEKRKTMKWGVIRPM